MLNSILRTRNILHSIKILIYKAVVKSIVVCECDYRWDLY
jgi:hypothetical protein